jgi:hypothetical protein
MKKILIFSLISALCFAPSLPAQKGDKYEPELLKADIDKSVLIYVSRLTVGTTTLKVDNPAAMSMMNMKTRDKKRFWVIKLTNTSLTEAIDKAGKTVTYGKNIFRLNKKGLTAMNAVIKSGAATVEDLVNAGNDSSFMSNSFEGSPSPPERGLYVKLRKLAVYDFIVQGPDRKLFPLQIAIEYFTDADGNLIEKHM